MNAIALNQKEIVKETCTRIVTLLVAFFACLLLMGTKVYAQDETGELAKDRITEGDEASFKDYLKEHIGYDGSGTIYNKGLPTSVYNKLKVNYETSAVDSGYHVVEVGKNGSKAYVSYDSNKVNTYIKQINNQTSYNTAQSRVNKLETELGLQADTAGASEALSGITPFISLIAGFIVILLTAFMLVFTAIDCVYIAYPVFRNKCEDAKASGNKLMTKTGSDGESKLRWVTDDAQAAIETCTIDSGKNKWAFYLKKRIISYIMLGIVIFMFFTGNITLLIEVAIKAVSGLMNVLKGFGA